MFSFYYDFRSDDIRPCSAPRRTTLTAATRFLLGSRCRLSVSGHGRQIAAAAFLATAAALTAAPTLAQHADTTGTPQLDLPRLELRAGLHRLDVQVASTPKAREIGLMYRQQMPAHEGMLFVFNTPGVQCFWMKNTLIPLTAAFLADDGRIVNLVDMAPLTTQSHCSTEPVRYVLEMNQGWFDARHIKAGHKLQAPLFASP